jgi:glycosyltransferase involved in cell wall biosynthesis
MRIVHVTDCYLPRLGGIELQVHDLAERQAADGHDVTVLTTTVGRDGGPSGAGVVRLGGVGSHRDVIRYRRSGRGRRVIADVDDIDVVHAHASSFSPLAFLVAHHSAGQGIPTVATVHSLWASADPLFHLADRVTHWGDWPVAWSAVSGVVAAQVRRVLAGRGEVHVLPNGIDPGHWQAPPVRVAGDELRLVVVARLVPRKRLIQLLRILRDVSDRLPRGIRISVDIIGDGPERPNLEHHLRKHDMTDWVRLRGRLTRAEIRATLARAHLFVSVAVLESFGIAALEARSTGLPVLARAGAGIQDFIRDGREGWIVDSDRAVADTIVALAHDPARLDQVRVHNCARLPTITWASVMASCDALYQAAAARQGRPLPVSDRMTPVGRAMWTR